jgi:NitT/TauT family transport system substrate-binding protein
MVSAGRTTRLSPIPALCDHLARVAAGAGIGRGVQEETMRPARGRLRAWLVGLGAGLAVILGPAAAPAPEPVKIRMGNLGFPSHSAMILNILKEKGFDRKHGIDMEAKVYGAVSAYYASAASGETDGVPGGPLVFQRMRLEGVPIKIVSTMVDMTSMSVITKDPSIRSITDLKGKTIAADMASSEYSVLSLYAKSRGVVLGRDATVVQAGPTLVRTQLAADRVDAGMTWEPTATLTMRDNPAYRIVFNGKQGWRELTGKDGWLLVLGLREDWIARNAAALPRVMAAFDEAAQFMRSNPDDSDRILQQAIKLPAGAFKDMITAPRVVFQVRSTAEPTARETLWEVIKVAIAEGYFKEPVRDQSVIHVP